jgi:hypothetical protein
MVVKTREALAMRKQFAPTLRRRSGPSLTPQAEHGRLSLDQ